ncbi:AsmA-like C-terminal region-containing protein [Isosphaeraceae bacterium EP7]
MARISRRTIVLSAILGAFLGGVILYTFVIPAVIARALRAEYGGRVEIGGWWVGISRAGVTGLTVYEAGADGPAWASAESADVDLGLTNLLAGRWTPGDIKVNGPKLALSFKEDGQLATRLPTSGRSGTKAALPRVVVEGATVTLAQRGGNTLEVKGANAELIPGKDMGSASIDGAFDHPTWGRWILNGLVDSAAGTAEIGMHTERPLTVRHNQLATLPFVPAAAWEHLDVDGPVVARLAFDAAPGSPPALHAQFTLNKTQVTLKSAGLVLEQADGLIKLDGKVLTLTQAAGKALGGTVQGEGTMDFSGPALKFDMIMDLAKVDVALTPPAWHLKEFATSGSLTGKAHVVASLAPDHHVDLTGSEGDAVIEGAVVQGIPVKSMRLTMTAQGEELRYDSPPGDNAASRPAIGPFGTMLSMAVVTAGPQNPAVKPSEPPAEPAKPAPPKVQLPKTLSTQFELEDVDLKKLAERLKALAGIDLPPTIAGKMSLKAKATIPIADVRDIKKYAFHGEASLSGASIEGVDLGRATARLDLADGVLELTEFRGQLLDRPAGDAKESPVATPPPPMEGPLPPGAFRGRLRAQIEPKGPLTAKFEARALPIGELLAPWLPRPTPISGAVSARAEFEAPVDRLKELKAWVGNGRLETEEVRYRGATLDAAVARFSLADGVLDMPELAGRLAGKPLAARLNLNLAAPYATRASLEVIGWKIDDVLAFVPSAPRPSPASGRVEAKAELSGTLADLKLTTDGKGRVLGLKVEGVELGDVPFQWVTEGNEVIISGIDARPLGGTLSAHGRIPLAPDRPSTAEATFAGIETSGLARAIPGAGISLAGKAGGKVSVRLLPANLDSAVVDLDLTAASMVVQGLPAERVVATVRKGAEAWLYEMSADSLGGKIRLKGQLPGPPQAERDGRRSRTDAHLIADRFSIDGLMRALNGGGSGLNGDGSLNANLRLAGDGTGLYARGRVQLQNLRRGSGREAHSLGAMKGIITLTPAGWTVDPLEGEFWGGALRGILSGETPKVKSEGAGSSPVSFEIAVDRANLARLADGIPQLAGRVEGLANLRLKGRSDAGMRADGDVRVARATLFGIPVTDLDLPIDLQGSGDGASRQLNSRRWTARVAGGRLVGNLKVGIGESRAFDADVQLTSLDLESIMRLRSDSARTSTGKVSGKVKLSGPDPSRIESARGAVNLELTDASLLSVPVFREIDRFLGAASGGLFETGALHGVIARRQLVIEDLHLQGRLAQLQVTGTVGLDGALDLKVLVNTSQYIAESGQTLVGLIPGLREAVGRQEQALLSVTNFLSSRLLKLRVGGTVRNPAVSVDPSVLVGEAGLIFFSSALKLPLSFIR